MHERAEFYTYIDIHTQATAFTELVASQQSINQSINQSKLQNGQCTL